MNQEGGFTLTLPFLLYSYFLYAQDYFCLKNFGFVYDQSLQWKSSLDSVRHWSSNFFDYETGCLQCFLFGKQNNGTKTKVGLSTFHQIQHQTFFEFGG